MKSGSTDNFTQIKTKIVNSQNIYLGPTLLDGKLLTHSKEVRFVYFLQAFATSKSADLKDFFSAFAKWEKYWKPLSIFVFVFQTSLLEGKKKLIAYPRFI